MSNGCVDSAIRPSHVLLEFAFSTRRSSSVWAISIVEAADVRCARIVDDETSLGIRSFRSRAQRATEVVFALETYFLDTNTLRVCVYFCWRVDIALRGCL